MTGFFKQDSGETIINGRNILDNLFEAREIFSFVQQDDFLFNELTVAEHISLCLKIRGQREIQSIIDDKLNLLNLKNFKDVKAG